jgi:hypothetical protein
MQPWTFVHATDIHVGSPRSYRFQPAWNENWQTARRQIVEIEPELLLLGGDLARDGNIHRFELEAVRADLDALPFPCRIAAGNMDTGNKHTDTSGTRGDRNDIDLNMTSENLANFRDVFGPTEWTLVHRNARFTGVCDMIAGSGLPEEEPFWNWVEALADLPRADHHVWLMHSALFVEDLHEPNFDITDADHYTDWYFGVDEPHRGRLFEAMRASGVDLVLSGHVHCRKEFRQEGVHLVIGPSTAFSQWGDRWPDGDPTLGFLRCDVTPADIAVTFVPLSHTSSAGGYGPGGHPRPDQRDYSLAWVKGQ